MPPPLLPRIDEDTPASVPSAYGALNSSPSPGIVAAIVLGSIAGFLIVIWLIYTCLNIAPAVGRESIASHYMGGSSVLTLGTNRRDRRGSSRNASRRSRSRFETVEIRTRDRASGSRGRATPAPFIVEAGPETDSEIYMDRRRSRRDRYPIRTVSTMSDDDDEIVVVEEDLLPPRRGSRGRWDRSRRGSAYESERRSSRRSRDY